ncbi:MAG: OmpW family outer membrane protein [Candidatus Electrothrix sp. YB6]
MKKMIAAGAVLLLTGSGAQLVHAGPVEKEQKTGQGMHRDWAISGYVGAAYFDSEEKPDPFRPGVTHEMESDDVYKFGIILSKYYNDFSFNLGIEFMEETEVHDELDNKLAEHSHVPISLGVNYHFDTRLLDPYIGAGIGYSFNDGSESDFIAAQGISSEMDDSTFYFLTAGVEYPLSDRCAVFLAGQYTIGDTDMKASVNSPQRGTMEMEAESTMDRYEVNLGVKYFFNI